MAGDTFFGFMPPCQFENMLEECGIHPIIYYVNHDNDFPQMSGKYHPQMIYHDQNKWL